MSGIRHAGNDDQTDRFADDPAFAVHEGGKLRVVPTRTIGSIADLSLTYTPGVARVSSAARSTPDPCGSVSTGCSHSGHGSPTCRWAR